MSFTIERREPGALSFSYEALRPWLEDVGPVAIVDLETTGLSESRSAEILEIGFLLLDAESETVGVGETLVRPRRPIPPLVSRLTGLVDSDVAAAPRMIELRDSICEALTGRVVVAHQCEFERSFLRREVDSSLGTLRYLDTQDVLALTHPDAPDLRLETFSRLLLDREERHRALDDALDAAGVLARIAHGAQEGEKRYVEASGVVERHLPSSPWRALLSRPLSRAEAPVAGSPEADFDFVEFAQGAASREPARDGEKSDRFVEIGPSTEEPVPFELDAIVAALRELGSPESGARVLPRVSRWGHRLSLIHI